MNVMKVDIILLCLVISETWTFHLQSQTRWFLKLLQFVPKINKNEGQYKYKYVCS